jgi:carbon storage regulator CsrA
MLILSRRAGERIFIIGPDMKEIEVCITVRHSKGGQISLGIDASKAYTILREEVFLRNAQQMKGLPDLDPGSYRNQEWPDGMGEVV